MKTCLTILCDNSISRSGFIGEHGFSVLINRGEQKYLLDTGPGMSLPLNLQAAGQNLDGLNGVFLSHGHCDHTGGLKWVVQQTGQVKVVAHPALFSEHMVLNRPPDQSSARYIGVPVARHELESLGAAFFFLDHTEEVFPGGWFLTGMTRLPELTPQDDRLWLRQGGRLIPDAIAEDANLLLDTDSGPVLLLGCAHAGILNVLRHLRADLGITRLHAVLGGTHLMFYGLGVIGQVIDELEKVSIEVVGLSHCSGFLAAAELSRHFGDRFRLAAAGSVFNF
jgi:7,8-dihydropterin-6-yl-methyl-4-(beta-D-ribofuranosyl)aminobenzene 5'-phosphate synthase